MLTTFIFVIQCLNGAAFQSPYSYNILVPVTALLYLDRTVRASGIFKRKPIILPKHVAISQAIALVFVPVDLPVSFKLEQYFRKYSLILVLFTAIIDAEASF